MSDKILVICVGLPRSGKSTWAREQVFPIVNPDSIRLALHGNHFIGLAENFVWAIAKVMVRALFLAGHDEVILDATNTTKKSRDQWRSKSWKRRYQVFAVDPEICKSRAMELEDKKRCEGLLSAIDRMHSQFEKITAGEHDL